MATRKMPPFHVQEGWKKDAERDARALVIMRERGCSFSEAWLAADRKPKLCNNEYRVENP